MSKHRTSDFLPLRGFYAHKNAVFFASYTKKHKKHKNHKDANKRTNNFPHLRCFLCTQKCYLFCFCSLVCVLCFFVCVKRSRKKKQQRDLKLP